VNHYFVYCAATISTGMGYLLTGEPETALRLFQETLEHPADQFGLMRVRILPLVAGIQLLLGNLSLGLQAAQECLKLAAAKPMSFDTGRACSFAGMICYEWNELAAANRHFLALLELVHTAPASAVIDALLGLALIQQAQGQPMLAQAQVDQALAIAIELRWPKLQLQIRSFQARLLLLQGQVTAAARQIQTIDTNMPLSVMAALEVPQLTQARVLLAQADAASLTTARDLLQTVWSAAETMHNVWRMVETLALQALLYQTQGQIELALATLATAVTPAALSASLWI
jgi:tetratricopeptide (TPR) repeat protein